MTDAANIFKPGRNDGAEGRAMKVAAEALGFYAGEDYRNWSELARLLANEGLYPDDLIAWR